jgi:DNA-binding transcriptional regulator YbjK
VFNTFGNMPMNNNLIQQYKQFRSMVSGDPKQQVQQMLNSGQLSQQRFNELMNTAEQLQRMMR